MRLEEYFRIDAVNFSTLKVLSKSPKHYRHAVKEGRDDTTALLKFRATHVAILEPEKFDAYYTVYPGKRRAGQEWKDFQEEHKGQEILKADEREKILAQAAAVHEDLVAGKLLEEGTAEESITWVDPITKLKCKARLDFWTPSGILLDLKSGPTASRLFGNLAAKLYYPSQLAWYGDGFSVARGIDLPYKKIIVVESEPPFDVAVFTLSEDDVIMGREVYQEWLRQVVECRERSEWPGRYAEEQPLSLPRHVFYDDNQEDGSMVVLTEDEDA